jgi:hypothetical protein
VGSFLRSAAPRELGSDFAARLAALEPLSEQDPGVPEPVATQAADELPQIHWERRGRRAPHEEYRPVSSVAIPPKECLGRLEVRRIPEYV